MKKAFGFAVAATMVIGGAASADVLYHNPAGSRLAVDQEFGDLPQLSTYLVADINIPAPGFFLTSVTSYYSAGIGDWGGISTARLHLFPKVGNLPDNITDDPTASMIVPVSFDVDTGTLSTVGLNLDVVAGDYWIGLTAIAEFFVKGQEFHREGVNVNGDPDAYRNPLGGFGLPDGTNWGEIQSWAYADIALTVEGVPIPPPGALALLALGAVGLRRKRMRAA